MKKNINLTEGVGVYDTRYKIAILYICIGKYIVFWDDFFKSSENLFCKNCTKNYFVFTDFDKKMIGEETGRVHKIFQEDLGWPNNSLKRFEMFASIEQNLREYDFVFFFNANTIFVKEIKDDFLPIEEDFTLVEHYLFYNRTPLYFSYDRNPKSTAFIPYLSGEYYIRGGVNGGKTEKYLEMIHTCLRDVEENEKRGIVSIWHDETHLNHFMLTQKNCKVLDPGFCYTQYCNVDCNIFILMREKAEYFNIKQIKKENETLFIKLKNKIKKHPSWIFFKKILLAYRFSISIAKMLLSILFFYKVIRRIRLKYGRVDWGF